MIFLRTFEGMLPMQLGISKELEVFLLSCITGACLGLFYQVLRIARIAAPHLKIMVFVEDMLFGLLCGGGWFMIFTGYDISMRWFIAFGMGLSGVLIHFLIGAPLIRLFARLDRKIKEKLLLPPLGFIAKKAGGIGRRFVQKYKKSPICKKIIKNRLKHCRRMVYNKKASDTIKKGEGAVASKSESGKRSILITILGVIAILCLIGYAIWTILSQRSEIEQLKQDTQELSDKITVAKQQNDEFTRLLSEDDEDTYMEQIAIGKLGYAYPGEKRFYIINGD